MFIMLFTLLAVCTVCYFIFMLSMVFLEVCDRIKCKIVRARKNRVKKEMSKKNKIIIYLSTAIISLVIMCNVASMLSNSFKNNDVNYDSMNVHSYKTVSRINFDSNLKDNEFIDSRYFAREYEDIKEAVLNGNYKKARSYIPSANKNTTNDEVLKYIESRKERYEKIKIKYEKKD